MADTHDEPGASPGHEPGPTAGDDAPRPAADPAGRWRRWRLLVAAGAVAVLLAGGAGILLAGRNGSGSATGGGASAGAGPFARAKAAAFAFAACMRSHGIGDWPDPAVEDGGGISLSGGFTPSEPRARVASARTSCEPLLGRTPPTPTGAQARPKLVDPAAFGWKRISAGGGCECAFGAPYSFYDRPADASKVVLFLDGGGACWSAATCSPGGGNRYQTTVEPPNAEGVFDFANKANPLAGYSFVFAPYCTADVFVGDATTTYAKGLTVYHKGYVNGTAALDHLARTYPHATDVVVIGSSAGSVSAPLYAALAHDRLPHARITSISDSSGTYPDSPQLDALFTGRAWQTAKVLPGWPGTPTPLSVPGLYIMAARHDPAIVFARHDHANDEDQRFHLNLAGLPTNDLPGLLKRNEAQIESAGVTLHSYTAPGTSHVSLMGQALYTETTAGTPLTTWLAALVTARPPADVP